MYAFSQEKHGSCSLLIFLIGGVSSLCKAANYALNNPEPKALPKSKEQIDYDDLSDDELGGLSARQLKRIEREEKKKTNQSRGLILDENSDGEAPYSLEEQVMLHMTLAESNFTMGEWKECIRPYQFVVTNEADEERRGYAILQLINSFIALEQYDDAKDSILDLYETDARYNIRVNMA